MALRILLSEVIRSSKLSREQIAERMSAATGVSITCQMLNCYSAESKEKHRFPAAFIPAFCRATGDLRLVHFLLGKFDLIGIERWQQPVLELGERVIATRMSQREIEGRVEELVNGRSHS